MDKYSQSRGRKVMMKSLRPGGIVTNNSSSNTPSSVPTTPPVSTTPTTSAKLAANMIWAPSNSVNVNYQDIGDEEDYDFSDFSTMKISNPVQITQDRLKSEERSRAALKASKMVHYPSRRVNNVFGNSTSQTQGYSYSYSNNNSQNHSQNYSHSTGHIQTPHQPLQAPNYPRTTHTASYSNSPVRSLDSPNRSPTRSDDRANEREREREGLQAGVAEVGKEQDGGEDDDESLLKKIKGVDLKFAKNILMESNRDQDKVYWNDIAGLDQAKETLMETIVYPFLRPDLFKGLREPVSGMLLFGPPGTGKTMLARAAATESNSTFFSIQASSLTSKWYGESEKLVRALFQVAKAKAPSIIFVDEIDSLLSKRSGDGDDDTSRRLKNEFLVQWSELTKAAAGRDSDAPTPRVLVLAATNLPWGIDEAARRRFVRRQYIPLPEDTTREAHFKKLLEHTRHSLTDEDMKTLVELTDGYSGSDITSLAKDAAIWPIREVGSKMLLLKELEIRPISLEDFKRSMKNIRPSVNKEGLKKFEEWAREFGSSGA